MGKNNTTTRLNNEQRLEICSKWKEMHKVWTQKQLATWVHAEYGVDISQAAISKLLKKRDQEGDGNDVEGSINESVSIFFPGTFEATDTDYHPPDEHDLPDASDKDSIIEHVISITRTGESIEDEVESDSADLQPAVPIQQRIEILQNALSNALIMDEEIDVALERLIKRKISALKSEIAANATQTSLKDYFRN